MILRVLQLGGPKLRIFWTFITACLTFECKLVGPVDEQVIFGNICELHEIRTQGPLGSDVKFNIVSAKSCRSLDLRDLFKL